MLLSRRQPRGEPPFHPSRMSRLTLPDHENPPTTSPQRPNISRIALSCGAPLLHPEFRPCLNDDSPPTAVVTMPKAAMHKDHRPIFCEDDVRLPWKVLPTEPKAVTQGMQNRPHTPLRPSILAADGGHVAAPLFVRVNVAHAPAASNEV
jgi:hypothetical protein